MSDVWERSKAKGTQRLVLLAIADCANDEGVAWPSFLGLARKTLLGRSTVVRLLGELRALGELDVDSGGGRESNVYRVRVPHLSEADAKETRPTSGPVSDRDVPLWDGSRLPGETAPVPHGRHEPSRNRQRTITCAPHVGFDDLWREFPRKEGKAAAIKAWNKLAPDEPLRATILAAVRRQKAARRWWVDKEGRQGGLHASTWLNQSMWTDEVVVAGPSRLVGVGADIPSVEKTRAMLREKFG